MPLRSRTPGLRSYLLGATLATAGLVIALLPAGTPPAAADTSTWAVTRVPISLARLVAIDPATDMVYIDNGLQVSVVDGATSTIAATISLGAGVGEPRGLAVDPATDTLYVTAYDAAAGASTVSVVNAATNTVTTTITEPASSDPMGVAVDSGTDTVYVANWEAGSVSVIDGATDTITATVSLGSGAHALNVAVDQVTDVAYVAGTDTVWAIDGASDTVSATIGLGARRATGIAVDPDTGTVFLADNKNSDVAVINAATDAITTTISTGPGTDDVAVDPVTDTVFASGAGTGLIGMGMTSVIDGASDTVTATLPRGGYTVAADAATGTAYAPGFDRHAELWVISPSAANELSPVIVSDSATAFAVGTSGSFTVLASAQPAATFTEIGALPSGITLSTTGKLAGTPASGTTGSYPITITASNGIGPDYSQAFTLTVGQPPAITSPASTTFRVGTAGSFDAQATGAPAPTFSANGTLPSGVTFSSDGTLAGTPARGTGGRYAITIYADNGFADATQAFTLFVDQATAITSASNATFRAGVRNKFTLRTSGFPAALLRERGRLPEGVRFSARQNGTAVLVGTPVRSTRGRKFVITIIASNGIGPAARKTFTLRISRGLG